MMVTEFYSILPPAGQRRLQHALNVDINRMTNSVTLLNRLQYIEYT